MPIVISLGFLATQSHGQIAELLNQYVVRECRVFRKECAQIKAQLQAGKQHKDGDQYSSEPE